MKMLGPYSGYKTNVNAVVSNELNAAGLRFGHGAVFRKVFALPYGYDLNTAGKIELKGV